MKKNLAKRIVLGLLTGAVLMSSSVAWAGAGTFASGDGDTSIYVGYDSDGGGVGKGFMDSVAIGSKALVGGHSSVALGASSEVAGQNSVALGDESMVSGAYSVALGADANVGNYMYSVALGAGSIASEEYVVSVGDGVAGSGGPDYRKIVNVKDGTSAHDVATVGQMEAITGLGYESIKNTNGLTYINSQGITLTGAVIALDKQVKANADAIANISGAGGNYVEKEEIAGGGSKTEIGGFSVQESASGSVTLGTSSSAVVTFEQDKVVFGENSSWYEEEKGFFAGSNDGTHDIASARAALKEDGGLMGASGKFIVDGATGNLGIGDGTKATFGIEAKTGNVTANGDVYVGGALVVGSNFAVDSASGNMMANSLNAAVDVFANGKSLVATANQVEDNKQAIEGKADKATTLEGYGITDAYTKAEVDSKIDGGSAAIAGINQRLEKTNAKINKVGAGAAALAALHPLDYDPDDKLTFSAGMGNYAGENAAALGAFYRPNEKFMLSLGGTMGNGENMVNLGLSIGLDKASGFAKMSKRELIQEVNAVKAENEAMKDQLANADERIAKLEALVAQLVAK